MFDNRVGHNVSPETLVSGPDQIHTHTHRQTKISECLHSVYSELGLGNQIWASMPAGYGVRL